jgi:hypothetical protein
MSLPVILFLLPLDLNNHQNQSITLNQLICRLIWVDANTKKDYKDHVQANQFDLNTLPNCGATTRSGGRCKHKDNINGRCKLHGRAPTGPINQAFEKNHHCYLHGLKTKEEITFRKPLSEMARASNFSITNNSKT